MASLGALLGLALAAVASAAAETPSLRLTIGGGDAFQAGTEIGVGEGSTGTLDVLLDGVLDSIDFDSISFTLNGTEILGFTRLGKTPTGLRLFVDRNAVRHRYLTLNADDNALRFQARDASGNRYAGEWVIRVREAMSGSKLLSAQNEAAEILERQISYAPEVRIIGSPEILAANPSKPKKFEARVQAEITDVQGISNVIVFVNGKQWEQVQIRNGFPIRKRGSFRRSGTLPGSVTGNGERLVIDIPVPLPKQATIVRIRAENVKGLDDSEARTVIR